MHNPSAATVNGRLAENSQSRRIRVELYKAIQKLRPAWHHDDDDKGTMKIVMFGSASDTLDWQKPIRSKERRRKSDTSPNPLPERGGEGAFKMRWK